MKALIYNSGLGKRMGELTKSCCKSMVKLQNGETIFERQIRLLQKAGIKDFIITTGPFADDLMDLTNQSRFKDLNFVFVNNPIYNETNYIYSMYLASKYIDDDVVILHGDLVFDYNLVKDILNDERKNLATTNHNKKLPEKDFKARIKDGKIKEVSISIFDDDCCAFQPFYKLTKENVKKWLENVERFVQAKNVNVYAENAFNEISDSIPIEEFLYNNYFIDEIDNPDDLKRVSNDIRYFDFREQTIIRKTEYKNELKNIIGNKNVLVVTGSIFANSKLEKYLQELDISYTTFTNYSANPKYEDVISGVKCYKENNCNFIISYGGGSSIDVAKCIKLFAALSNDTNYLTQEFKFSDICHLAIPTTAGTGSESTRFAVIYEKGVKKSITHDCIIPDYVILDYTNLMTLPDYQKKAPLLDALCQGIESFWSINSNDESKKYAKLAIELILNNWKDYLKGEEEALNNVLQAANLAGKAINISQTTAAHAMSYKITSLYGFAHGHAVAICISKIMRYMLKNINECNDVRGKEYIINVFHDLCDIFKVKNLNELADYIENMLNIMQLPMPTLRNNEELEVLINSVNKERLKNNPININNDIENIYRDIFRNSTN